MIITRKKECSDVQYLFLFLVVELLHPAPHGHLDHLQTGDVNLLDEAQDARQDVRILK